MGRSRGSKCVCVPNFFPKSLKPRLRYGDFSIFQDGGRPSSWIFKSWKFQLPFPFRGLICVIIPNFEKIDETVPKRWLIYDYSRWLCHHLGFWKFQIFNGSNAQQVQTASTCQILSKSLKTRLRYGDFSIFKDAGPPPSWIFKSWKFQLPEIWPIFDFSKWRPPPSWIFEIPNF